MAFGFSALSKLKGRDFDGSAGRLKKRKEASSRRPDPHDPFAHGAAIHRALHPDAVSGGGSIAAHYSTHSFLQRFGKDQLLESAPALVDDDEPRGDNGNNSSVPGKDWDRILRTLRSPEPATVRAALLAIDRDRGLLKLLSQDQLDRIGSTLCDIMASHAQGAAYPSYECNTLAESLIYHCVAISPVLEKSPWVRARALDIMWETFNAIFEIEEPPPKAKEAGDEGDKQTTSLTTNKTLAAFSSSTTSPDRLVRVLDWTGRPVHLMAALIPWINNASLWGGASFSEAGSSKKRRKSLRKMQKKSMTGDPRFDLVLFMCTAIISGRARYWPQPEPGDIDSAEPAEDPPPIVLVQVQVLRSLTKDLRRTPRNRRALAPLITAARWLAGSIVKKKKIQAKGGIRKKKKQSNELFTAHLDELLVAALSNFFSVWYPRPSDVLLRLLPATAFPITRALAATSSVSHDNAETADAGAGQASAIESRAKTYSKAKFKINCHKLSKNEIVKKIIKLYENS